MVTRCFQIPPLINLWKIGESAASCQDCILHAGAGNPCKMHVIRALDDIAQSAGRAICNLTSGRMQCGGRVRISSRAEWVESLRGPPERRQIAFGLENLTCKFVHVACRV